MDTGREPNWRKWQNVPEIKLWEGVALSLNIEPSEVSDDPPPFKIGNQHSFSESEEFMDRLFLVERTVESENGLINAKGKTHWVINSFISISKFAAWALSVGWVMPDQFASLAAAECAQSSIPQFDENSPTYPKELDIALQAWRAVSQMNDNRKPKARTRAWLDANRPELSNEAKRRIATSVNWDKSGGATRTSKK